jgi:hypothetical protein
VSNGNGVTPSAVADTTGEVPALYDHVVSPTANYNHHDGDDAEVRLPVAAEDLTGSGATESVYDAADTTSDYDDTANVLNALQHEQQRQQQQQESTDVDQYYIDIQFGNGKTTDHLRPLSTPIYVNSSYNHTQPADSKHQGTLIPDPQDAVLYRNGTSASDENRPSVIYDDTAPASSSTDIYDDIAPASALTNVS